MIEKIDHIGIAVHSIQAQVSYYRDVLGLQVGKTEEIPSEGVRVCLIAVGDVHIELLEPIAGDSPLRKFIEKHGEGFHHIAYKTNDMAGVLAAFRANHLKLIYEEPKKGAGGKRICFAHPQSTFGVLTEISESEQ